MSMSLRVKKTLLTGAMLAATLTFGSANAGQYGAPPQPLSGVDTMLTSIVSKSYISGGLEKDANGNLSMDANGNFKFNFTGSVHSPMINPQSGQLMGTHDSIGTVSGQAAFPPSFAMLAMQVYGWLMNGADPSQMPASPSKIDWTMNDLTLVVDGTTYRPIANPDYSLDGRAFTGFGPVEIGQILNGANGLSMSVRMGGCMAMQGVAGPNSGKIGTQCLNGTFTFDLSGIDLNNPMASTLNGTATSNCWLVLQQPMM
ncbi:MAG TPA: hypothetical protein VGE50_03085 [Gammaproteobacteria bacterium]